MATLANIGANEDPSAGETLTNTRESQQTWKLMNFQDLQDKQATEDHLVMLTTGAVSTITPTEHNTTPSLSSSSQRSRSSSFASNSKSPESMMDDQNNNNNCFVCLLRIQENEELEQRLNAFREVQRDLEEEIAQLSEKSETTAAEFETLAALYHADQKDLHERIHLLEANKSMLETSFIELEDQNLTLMAELKRAAEANVKQHKVLSKAKKGVSNDEEEELQENLRKLQEENMRLRKSVNDLEEEKRSLEECVQRGAQRSRELRRSRRELEESMSNLKKDLENKTAEFKKRSDISLAERESLHHRVRFLEDENLIIGRTVNDLVAEKDVLELKLMNAERRTENFKKKEQELEAKITRLQGETKSSGVDFDSLSVISYEARNEIAEQCRLVEEESSILQQSLEFLEKENAAFEAKLKEAESMAAQKQFFSHDYHENERRLLRDRIMELVHEKRMVVHQYENALNLTKNILGQMETQVQTFEVELLEERMISLQLKEELMATQAQLDEQSKLAEATLMEKAQLDTELQALLDEMCERENVYEQCINAFEAELEMRDKINTETEAVNSRLRDEVSMLSSVLLPDDDAKKVKDILEEMRSEADWYRTIAKGYEAELELLQQQSSRHNENDTILDDSSLMQAPFVPGPQNDVIAGDTQSKNGPVGTVE